MSDFSEGGSEILRHEAGERDFEPTAGDSVLVEGVTNHLDAHLGEPSVFHELVSDLVHVDVHMAPPTAGRDWSTLMTSGMAERPMTVPDELEDYRFAELMLALPAGWPLSQDAFEDEAHYWPIRLLKQLARLPHEFETFLYYGHTIPNGDPPEPYAPSTELCCALITEPVLVPSGFDRLTLSDGRAVHVYAVVPIDASETTFKLDKGFDALAALLEEHHVSELLDPGRPSVVPRKGLFRR